MSDTYFELKLDFKAKGYRDIVIKFLNDEGPTFEEDVEETYRYMFPLMDDVEPPMEIKEIGDTRLWAYFELYADGIISAQSIMKAAKKAGALKVNARFSDLDGNEVYWTLQNGKLIAMYTRDDDEIIDKILLELDDEEKLEKIISMYESGKLKGRIDVMY